MDVQDKEFVKLTRETIRQFIADREQERDAKTGVQKRRLDRWPFPAPIQLWRKLPDGQEVQMLATCRNLNDHGVGVLCDKRIEMGVQVELAIHQPEVTYYGRGVVRHCTSSKREYFVGIEFIDPEGM